MPPARPAGAPGARPAATTVPRPGVRVTVEPAASTKKRPARHVTSVERPWRRTTARPWPRTSASPVTIFSASQAGRLDERAPAVERGGEQEGVGEAQARAGGERERHPGQLEPRHRVGARAQRLADRKRPALDGGLPLGTRLLELDLALDEAQARKRESTLVLRRPAGPGPESRPAWRRASRPARPRSSASGYTRDASVTSGSGTAACGCRRLACGLRLARLSFASLREP